MSWKDKVCSPSRLDNYITYLSGYTYNFGETFEEYTEDMFLNGLLGLDFDKDKSAAEAAGTACHEMLQFASYGTLKNEYIINGWKIINECDAEVELPLLREIPVSGTIGGYNLKGTVDALDATTVFDHKFTSSLDVDKYMSSLQWKTYLLLTGRKQFVYNLFEVKVNKELKTVTIKGYHRLKLHSYDGMQAEVELVLSDYLSLLDLLKDKISNRCIDRNVVIEKYIQDLMLLKIDKKSKTEMLDILLALKLTFMEEEK